MSNGFDDLLDTLRGIESGLNDIQKQDGEIVFSDSRRIGPGIGPKRNQMGSRRPQPTREQAIVESAYLAARKQQPHYEEYLTAKEQKQVTNSVVEKMVLEIIDQDIMKQKP